MNVNSSINTDFIRDSSENVQSSFEEVACTQDIEENQQNENETDFCNSDSEHAVSDTDLISDVESEEERPNLEQSTKTGRNQEETYIPTELKQGIFKFLTTFRD